MGNYLNSINDNFKTKRNVGVGCLISIIILFLLIITISIQNYISGDLEVIFILSILTIILIITTIAIKTSPLKIKKTEIEILKIIIAFLKESKTEYNEIKQITRNLFSIYPETDIDKLIYSYNSTEINIDTACNELITKKTDVKYYLLSVLLDLSADDAILTINEENFITRIRKGINIHEKTYNYIKNNYLKKGLKEERKIIEEQNRKKAAESFSNSFLPYNAYKMLGISPSVTKSELKKAYRNLAKRHHPDKFHGQSETVIQKAKDKFQDITEAYEIIKRYKKHSK